MKKVMAFGTFDVFHKGHEEYLKQAKLEGDYLVVVIARDKNAEKIKGIKLNHDEDERWDSVSKSGLADKVLFGGIEDQLRIVEKENPNVIALGYDQKVKEEELVRKLERRGISVEIKRMKEYKGDKYKSSIIRRLKK